MTPFLRKLLGLNWLLLVMMLALAIFGVVAIYSATYMRGDSVAADFWRKQANWVAVGFFAFMITSLIDYRWMRWDALPMYLAGIFFLLLTKFIGQRVYGARSWLHLGPINFQPAQPAVAVVWSDRWSALSFDCDAARSRRSDHLDTGASGAVIRRWASTALLNLHHSHWVGVYSNCNQSWFKTVPAATDHGLYPPGHRQTRCSLGN